MAFAMAAFAFDPVWTLLAMGVAPEIARGAVRVSLGASNTEAHVIGFLQALGTVTARLRNLTAMAV